MDSQSQPVASDINNKNDEVKEPVKNEIKEVQNENKKVNKDAHLRGKTENPQTYKGIENIIFDAGAFIKGLHPSLLSKINNAPNAEASTNTIENKNVNLDQLTLYTVPDVIAEVKDPNARKNLEFILPNIRVKEPSPESLKKVVEFSKKTGDFAALSKTDLKVLALTYMIELQVYGNTDHIKSEPTNKLKEVKNFKLSNNNNTNTNTNTTTNTNTNTENNSQQSKDEADTVPTATETATKVEESQPKKEESVEPKVESQTQSVVSNSNPKPKKKKRSNKSKMLAKTDDASSTTSQSTETNSTTSKNDDDDEKGWITPDNIASYNARLNGKVEDKTTQFKKVGCITTDFAIQNVLLQMGLKLLSVDGMAIRKLKQWILKCHACNKITREVDKIFCPACGNNTLIKVAVVVKNGEVFQISKDRIPSIRGTKYSLPKPKGGRNNNEIILSEDQYNEKLRKTRKHKTSEDVFDADYMFASGMKAQTSDIVVGYGRKNPNVNHKKFGKSNKSRAN